jgi:hypothetical protein
MAAAAGARRRAKIERTNATLNLLATACDNYWSVYRNYPVVDSEEVGLGTSDQFDNVEESRTVSLVYILSIPRHPRPMLKVGQQWFHKVDHGITVPDGRTLYMVVDGFHHMIEVERDVPDEGDEEYKAAATTITFTSAGPDGEFGEDEDDEEAEDNIEKVVRR